MRDTDLDYLAGVIDSDGFISISRTTKTRAGCARPGTYYSARSGIAGTRRQPHDFAAALFGGSVSAYTPVNQDHREQFNWTVTGTKAALFIKAIRPYLRIKTQQADLALELQELVVAQFAQVKREQTPPYRIGEAMRAQRERLFQLIRPLNQDRRHIGRRAAGDLLDGVQHHEWPVRRDS